MENQKNLIRAAMGELPFDLVVRNARLVNVYTERIEEAVVGIKDGRICVINPKRQKAEQELDCAGAYLVPGLVDAHMHIETSQLNPGAWAELAVPHGTTAIFTDPMELANVSGTDGVRCFAQMLNDLPLHAFLEIPSRVPAAEGLETSGGVISPDETRALLEASFSASLGEVNATEIGALNENTLQKIAFARQLGKVVNGHMPCLSWTQLNAAAAAGISDDHESTAFSELEEKLSLGIAVMIREGSIEPNLAPLVKGILAQTLPTDSLMFCTDDKNAEDLCRKGHIDFAVKKAISLGMPPVKAVKLATLNPARHFGLEAEFGSITPGRSADFLLVSDLEKFKIEAVYFKGKLAAQEGKACFKMSQDYRNSYPALCQSVMLSRGIMKEELFLRSAKEVVSVRVMGIEENSLLVTAREATVRVVGGFILPDTAQDILPVAVIERYGKNGGIGHGLIHGIGIQDGAICSSLAQEGNNLVACGTNAEDMLIGLKEVARMNGGIVVVQHGSILAKKELELGGIISLCSVRKLILQNEIIERALYRIGCRQSNAATYLSVATCTAIPHYGLSDMGLVDVNTHQIVPVILS